MAEEAEGKEMGVIHGAEGHPRRTGIRAWPCGRILRSQSHGKGEKRQARASPQQWQHQAGDFPNGRRYRKAGHAAIILGAARRARGAHLSVWKDDGR
jgi:hypothetical protein